MDIEDIEPYEGEVKELFAVPLSYLFDCEVQEFKTESLLQMPADFPYEKIASGREYNFRVGKYPVLFIDFDDKTIWGITARITASFIRTLKDLSQDF